MKENIANAKIKISEIKKDILSALAHPEADEGLYFRNFQNLHEEDERPIVRGTQKQALDALKELIEEGKVIVDDSFDELIFKLSEETHHTVC